MTVALFLLKNVMVCKLFSSTRLGELHEAPMVTT